MDRERAVEILETATVHFEALDQTVQETENKIHRMEEIHDNLLPFLKVDLRFEDLTEYRFVTYHFGRMPTFTYNEFNIFSSPDKNLLFVEAGRADGFVYGIYFTTNDAKDKAESLLSTYHFEQIWIPYELDGTPFLGAPEDVCRMLTQKLAELRQAVAAIHTNNMADLDFTAKDLSDAFHKIRELSFYADAGKYAAKTKRDYFIIVGWMRKKDAALLERELEQDKSILFTIDDGAEALTSGPPTKMKNFFLFRPFEFFVRMYGLPSYKEVDPTVIIALTYSLLFGLMFGDVGQGAVLSLLGYYMYRKKGFELGAVMCVVGLFSILFGFLYGSFFGMDDVIQSVWMSPAQDIMGILYITIGLGAFLILLAMILNIVNAARQKNVMRALFGSNGLSGILFYGTLIYLAATMLFGGGGMSNVATLFAAASLLLVVFTRPVYEMAAGKQKVPAQEIPSRLFEILIEAFEVLLSYFSNTLSFVRVGAFALAHVGIMTAVTMLARGASGSLRILPMVLGNIVVIGLEGLVVGIQALRLDFYEIFGRFFEGNGREFVPFKHK